MGSIQMGQVFHKIPEISQCESEQHPENTLNHVFCQERDYFWVENLISKYNH
jgi:hypothetical protein